MAKKKKKEKEKNGEAKMDMTPMIDVTFLLLIFFLCLEFKTLEGKLATNLPKDVGVNKSKAEPIEKLDLRIEIGRLGPIGAASTTTGASSSSGTRCATTSEPAHRKQGPARNRLRKAVKKVTDKHGKKKPRPITIKTGPSVCYQRRDRGRRHCARRRLRRDHVRRWRGHA